MTLSTDTTTMQMTRVINAPRERVYAAWTEPELASQWWGADGCSTEELILDAWRGGRLRWAFITREGTKVTVEGKFRVAHPPEKIIHTWQSVGTPAWRDALSIVTVELVEKEDNNSTEVRLTHEKLPDEKSRDEHTHAWNNALDKLELLLVVTR